MSIEYQDLREWLKKVETLGELQECRGLHWDKEMGAFVEMCVRAKGGQAPAFLFDQIPGYPPGYRCLYGLLNSQRRFAFSMGLPFTGPLKTMELLKLYRKRVKEITPVPPKLVSWGPVLENIQRDAEVDLFKFPVPIHHELDAGRYIGTADAVITRDPEDGWVNVGTYRMQLFERNLTGIYITEGKDGYMQLQKYLAADRKSTRLNSSH